MKTSLKIIALSILVSIFRGTSHADLFHYKNVLIGERASGMGGAFVALSDDPSGIYYNPAGIAFSGEDYFSLSANVYNYSIQTYKDVLPGKDYSYTSSGLIPALFGFTQSYSKSKWGFAVVVTNSDLSDQNDELTELSTTPGLPATLKRRYFRQDTTYLVGPGFATEIFDNFTIGLTLFGVARFNNEIDNQEIHYYPVGTGQFLFQNVHQSIRSYGILPKLGVQWMPIPKWSFGMVLGKLINAGGTSEARQVGSSLDSNNNPKPPTGQMSNDIAIATATPAHELPAPIQVSLGSAYFPSKSLLFAFDLDYYHSSGITVPFTLQSTLNWSGGVEYYLSDSSALRAGLYTNNSNTPPLSKAGKNQLPHVDVTTLSVGYSLVKPTSSLTLGISYGVGNGQGQAVANSTSIESIQQFHLAFYLTGSYQL